MARTLRIGNAHGFWGDRLEAAAEMLAAEPELDFITLDFLAEVSLSLLTADRARNPTGGWPRDVLEVLRSLAPYWRGGGQCRFIANAGGLNPRAAAEACRAELADAGCGHLRVAVVEGDDVLGHLLAASPTAPLLQNLDTGQSLANVRDKLLTANAYLGARGIAEALDRGADVVITGRVADPSLAVGPCVHRFGWKWDDWDRLAAATVAGHLIECGAQVTGGISTDWLELPVVAQIGFPIVEVADDGSLTVTKPRGSGGRVDERTVKEQLLYEIGDPDAYLSPDVSVSFLSLSVVDDGADRVRVAGAQGRPAPPTLKVSATYRNGFRAQGQVTIFGADAVAKARRAGQGILQRLRDDGMEFDEAVVECIGAGACLPVHSADDASHAKLTETVLRIAVRSKSEKAVEQFSRSLMSLVTAGPPGTTGYAAGRPRVQPMFCYWPCLINRADVTEHVTLLDAERSKAELDSINRESTMGGLSEADDGLLSQAKSASEAPPALNSPLRKKDGVPSLLSDVAHARSGDKGTSANIGVIARQAPDYDRLCKLLTAERVAEHLRIDDIRRVTRYELPTLAALNFVVRGILDSPLRTDAQGKALGQVLLAMPLPRGYDGSEVVT
jgi:hypothetical protein